jgi:hypothetical protein
MEKSIPTQNAKLFVPDSCICMSTHMNPDHEIMNPQENNMNPRLEIMNPRIKITLFVPYSYFLVWDSFVCTADTFQNRNHKGERHESAAE